VSPRAFALTTKVIQMSNGNYCAWFYRRKCLSELKMSLEEEMEWLRSNFALDLQKNYQIWHHRRCIVELLGADNDFEAEMDFLAQIFAEESKNYHAWSYRIWLVERFTLYEGELEYAESLLDDDVCNNSAWSYRFFILTKMPDSLYGTLEHARSEV